MGILFALFSVDRFPWFTSQDRVVNIEVELINFWHLPQSNGKLVTFVDIARVIILLLTWLEYYCISNSYVASDLKEATALAKLASLVFENENFKVIFKRFEICIGSLEGLLAEMVQKGHQVSYQIKFEAPRVYLMMMHATIFPRAYLFCIIARRKLAHIWTTQVAT